ncbi:hypothetical protein HBI70_163390 [Parastagonospora nodorum]|nr:hypothetical protein HBH53_135000 [Parastagonospora nodorum]KAH4003499.1 hypothetical protein HBI10_063000 [Parastagonospora nodorum]KAH4028721.1 hypothetical protein HBI13_039410 [Parastagonospora nodorum]KAH4065521.1 hypothetical protein HBH50_157610 [Parastagonospora nodorum]KAH4092011.1 hypothetical protein HBH48_080670 [Parastagonospora nodorum]
MSSLKIGQTVETSTNQTGIIKYIGTIHVAEGDWLGLELPTPTGKNDGSVRGERYFTCSPGHGLFIREANIVRIISQPAAKPTPKPKAPVVPKARPSSVVAPKPTPRASIAATKRQSIATTTAPPPVRAPVRKPSIAGSSTASSTIQDARHRSNAAASSASTTSKASRDTNVETLNTKIRHLEKQHGDDQDRIKDLAQAADERDRYKAIIEKLQSKYQTLHLDSAELKTQLQQLQSDNDSLAKKQEEHEADWEIALLDKEMAEERAEQAESELEAVRAKLEERDMEIEIMREEAAMFTTELSEEDKEAAGWYRLQHENDRLRQALITLKEMTEEKERDNKARFAELEMDLASLDAIRQEHTELQDRVHKDEGIIEHLRAQVDASAEWEDLSNELTDKIHDLEEKAKRQEATIRELESEAELNNELLVVHMDEEEDLHAELEAKDFEIAEHIHRLELQEVAIADNQLLVSKFRDLVYNLQSRLADAESSRTMTEAQIRDTTGRIDEVMDLNRHLRASNRQATFKEVQLGLYRLDAEVASKRLAISTEAQSAEFLKSLPVQTYFTAISVGAKASLTSSLLLTADREMSFNGGLEEAMARLSCVEAVQCLALLQTGSKRLYSAMETCDLADFAAFGPIDQELRVVEKTLDHTHEALVNDEINFTDMANSLAQSLKIQDAVLVDQQNILAMMPEDESTAHIQRIVARLDYLGSNFAVITTMMSFLASNATELLVKTAAQDINPDDVTAAAQRVLELFAGSSVICNKAVAAGQKLLRTVDALRSDSLYPHIFKGSEDIMEQEAYLAKLARDAAQWGRNTLSIINASFQPEPSPSWSELKIEDMFAFYWSPELLRLDTTAQRLDAWTEEASLLLNTSEIVHGPTPWAQKAKEMEAARKKNSEASVLLEKLKVEHKATLLSLHEREQVIETKSLEIEHLDAKYRDASNKVTDAQHLREKLIKTEQEMTDLRTKITDQHSQIEALEQNIARSDRSEHAINLPDATKMVTEPVEQPSASRTIPAQVNCLLSALQTENHWLRRREHTDMFDRNLKHVFGKMRHAQQKTYAQTIDRALTDVLLEMEESDDDSSLHEDAEDHAAAQSLISRPKMLPMGVGPVQTAWQTSNGTPEQYYAFLESNVVGPMGFRLCTIPKGDEDMLELWDDGASSVFESLSGEMGI